MAPRILHRRAGGLDHLTESGRLGLARALLYPESPIKDVLETLIAHVGGPAISIYVPTHRRGPEIEQDRIRLRNRIAHVDESLERLGLKPRERQEVLAEARSTLEDREFWEHRLSGVGMFIYADGTTTTVSMHNPAPERAVVADTFHIRPLLPDLALPSAQVLVLTMGRVGLYNMTDDDIVVIDADFPESFEDVNWFVDREAALQHHSDSRGGSRVHHGHDPKDRLSADRDRFLAAIDMALPPTDGSPLIVLGVDDLADRFIALSDRMAVSPERSGVEHADDTDLIKAQAAPSLVEIQAARQREVIELARMGMGRGTGLSDLGEALQAAISGRIGHLIMRADAEPVWGRFDPGSLELETKTDQGLGDVDLLDRLAVLALQGGADLRVVAERVDDLDWVAILRF